MMTMFQEGVTVKGKVFSEHLKAFLVVTNKRS